MKISHDVQNICDRLPSGFNCITITFEKHWLICLFADADEIDFQDRAHFRSLRLENNWLVELTRDEGRGWTFSVVDFIDLSWPQTTTLVPSSSFYADDKPSGVFAVLSFLHSTLLESTTGISFGSFSPLFRFVIYQWRILILRSIRVSLKLIDVKIGELGETEILLIFSTLWLAISIFIQIFTLHFYLWSLYFYLNENM